MLRIDAQTTHQDAHRGACCAALEIAAFEQRIERTVRRIGVEQTFRADLPELAVAAIEHIDQIEKAAVTRGELWFPDTYLGHSSRTV